MRRYTRMIYEIIKYAFFPCCQNKRLSNSSCLNKERERFINHRCLRIVADIVTINIKVKLFGYLKKKKNVFFNPVCQWLKETLDVSWSLKLYLSVIREHAHIFSYQKCRHVIWSFFII